MRLSKNSLAVEVARAEQQSVADYDAERMGIIMGMNHQFWKLSHGLKHFSQSEFLQALREDLVYVHRDTGRKGRSTGSQGEDFIGAAVGDYFYLTRGSQGVYCLGQFSGPVNILSSKRAGWLDRPFRVIRYAVQTAPFKGPNKWWTPNHPSTFSRVPVEEMQLFQDLILAPYFDLDLRQFGVRIGA